VPRKKRRSFTRDFKLAALKRMAETDNIRGLAHELGIERKLLYCWRDALAADGEAGLRRAGRPGETVRAAEAALAATVDLREPAPPAGQIAELERKIGQQQLELDFFRAALRHVREARRTNGGPGGEPSTR
jgi:transposase